MRSSQGCQHLRQEHIYFCTAPLLATLHCKSKCTAKIPRARVTTSAEFQLSLGKTPRRLQMSVFEVFICEWSVKLPTSRRRSHVFGLELSRRSLSCPSGRRTSAAGLKRPRLARLFAPETEPRQSASAGNVTHGVCQNRSAKSLRRP